MLLVVVVTAVGIAFLYALAGWYGGSAMLWFWLLLPTILGAVGLDLWRLARERSGEKVNRIALDRWTKWLTIAYVGGIIVTSLVFDVYQPQVSNRVAATGVPSGTTPPELTETERELASDCRIVRGDSLETVKTAYAVPYAPQKLDRVTPSGTAYQYHFARYGIWVFFDNQLLVSSLRFDAPFRGRIAGIGIGDSAARVRAERGPPVGEFAGFTVAPGGTRPAAPRATTAWTYSPGGSSFVRYDLLDDKVWSIIAYSCGPDI